jgi:hypothetical protein
VGLLDDLGDLVSSGGVGGVGSTSTSSGYGIFLGIMPNAPDKCVAIYESGGVAPVHAFAGAPGLAVLERPRVQVTVRADAFGYSTGRQVMNTIFKLLDGLPSRTINNTSYQWISAVQSPFSLGMDEVNRPLISVNFDVMKTLSSA